MKWPSIVERVIVVIAALLVAAYAALMFVRRNQNMWDPWSADGDQFQAVWHYWRYTIKGVFPPGDLLTDYAFVMHAPPAWWAMMATLSSLMAPVLAAKVLNIVAYVALLVAGGIAVSKRSHPLLGLCAVFLLARSGDPTSLISGGYARSFGPALVLAFLAAFITERHKTALVILVLQAALYPSVVLGCGPAYGAYTVLRGPTKRDRLRRMAGMLVAGLLIIGLGRFQEIAAPAWWGPIVTLKEADTMREWHRGGRGVPSLPLASPMSEIESRASVPFRNDGTAPLTAVSQWFASHHELVPFAILWGLAAASWMIPWRRRRREPPLDAPPTRPQHFPWQILALYAAALVFYFVARTVAFKLYIPVRVLSHTWPVLGIVAWPFAVWGVCQPLLRRRAVALAVAVVATVVPIVLIDGTGMTVRPSPWVSYTSQVKWLEFAKNTPRDAVFAGEINLLSTVPLFSHHRVLVDSNLAHPFRKGYLAECERRIRAMVDALYSTDLSNVVSFAEREHVDYFIYRPSRMKSPDGVLYEPIKTEASKLIEKRGLANLVLRDPPASSVVLSDGEIRIIDIAKLKQAIAKGEGKKKPKPLPVYGPILEPHPFIGPMPEPAPKKKPPPKAPAPAPASH